VSSASAFSISIDEDEAKAETHLFVLFLYNYIKLYSGALWTNVRIFTNRTKRKEEEDNVMMDLLHHCMYIN